MQVNAVALDERSIAFVGRFIENLEGNQERNTTGLELSNQAEKSYLQNCASCHGESAEGNRSLRIPPLTRQQDWYLLGQMTNFSEKKRVQHEEKQEELSDKDLKAIIAWIYELPTPDK
jgi:cytochrome c553